MQKSLHRSKLTLCLTRAFSTTSTNYRAAVLLHGSGVADGTEITEAVSILINLSKAGAKTQCFAPNRAQAHVISHITQETQNQTRNVLEESARIARGNCKDLKELKSSDFDVLIIPGGFGAAKNLSDFAFLG